MLMASLEFCFLLNLDKIINNPLIYDLSTNITKIIHCHLQPKKMLHKITTTMKTIFYYRESFLIKYQLFLFIKD